MKTEKRVRQSDNKNQWFFETYSYDFETFEHKWKIDKVCYTEARAIMYMETYKGDVSYGS